MPWLIGLYFFKLDQYVYYLWIINTIFSLTYVYSSAYYITQQKKFAVINFFILLLWPLYFVLHTIAAYWAIIETFTAPFKWNKTKHGISADELNLFILTKNLLIFKLLVVYFRFEIIVTFD